MIYRGSDVALSDWFSFSWNVVRVPNIIIGPFHSAYWPDKLKVKINTYIMSTNKGWLCMQNSISKAKPCISSTDENAEKLPRSFSFRQSVSCVTHKLFNRVKSSLLCPENWPGDPKSSWSLKKKIDDFDELNSKIIPTGIGDTVETLRRQTCKSPRRQSKVTI